MRPTFDDLTEDAGRSHGVVVASVLLWYLEFLVDGGAFGGAHSYVTALTVIYGPINSATEKSKYSIYLSKVVDLSRCSHHMSCGAEERGCSRSSRTSVAFKAIRCIVLDTVTGATSRKLFVQ